MKQDGVTLNMLKQLENPGERFLPLAPLPLPVTLFCRVFVKFHQVLPKCHLFSSTSTRALWQ